MQPCKSLLRLSVAALAACFAAGAQAQSGPIKIGVVEPTSGPVAYIGEANLAAFRFGAERVNAAGGVLGRKLEIVGADSELKPDVATRIGQAGTAIDGIEVNFRRDPTIYDGRFANNGWLQELPKPMTKLTWDNAALIAPSTAEAHELANGEVIAIQHEGRTHNVPVWIIPGHAQHHLDILRDRYSVKI